MSGDNRTENLAEWEWSTSYERLLLGQARAGEEAVRVRYRERGGDRFRSFLLMVDDEAPLSDELVLRAIAAHSAR